MSDFWERQREKFLASQPKPKPANTDGPWWMRGSGLPVRQEPLQGQQELDLEGIIDGHDVSKAEILQGRAEECPHCPRNPKTGIRGDMYRPTKTSAMRCFDCGYIDGRYFGEGQNKPATLEGKTHHAKQTVSGGSAGSNFHGNIRSASEAVARIG